MLIGTPGAHCSAKINVGYRIFFFKKLNRVIKVDKALVLSTSPSHLLYLCLSVPQVMLKEEYRLYGCV